MSYVIPLIVLFILVYGYFKKISIYDEFLKGAKEGLITIFNITPAVLAMVLAINIFSKSGVVEFLLGFLKPLFNYLRLPLDILSMAILRPISGNASLAIMNNIYYTYGVDSFASFLASILQGCTDTTIYVLALYFGSVHITKTHHALWVGLFADLCGIIAAFVLSYIFF